MVYVTGEGDFVCLSVKEILICFDTAYGKCVGKYGLKWIEELFVRYLHIADICQNSGCGVCGMETVT